MRLFALGELEPPDPPPPGRRAAGRRRTTSSSRCAGSTRSARSSTCRSGCRSRGRGSRSQDGMLWLWDDDADTPARSRCAPPRRRAWRGSSASTRRPSTAGAATAARSPRRAADALARDAERVVLFTDVDNPAPEQGLPADRLPPAGRPPRRALHDPQPSSRGRPLAEVREAPPEAAGALDVRAQRPHPAGELGV